jgi:hypothetical protein
MIKFNPGGLVGLWVNGPHVNGARAIAAMGHTSHRLVQVQLRIVGSHVHLPSVVLNQAIIYQFFKFESGAVIHSNYRSLLVKIPIINLLLGCLEAAEEYCDSLKFPLVDHLG